MESTERKTFDLSKPLKEKEERALKEKEELEIDYRKLKERLDDVLIMNGKLKDEIDALKALLRLYL